MALGIRPTVDYAFKRLLGDPAHAALTLHFLNAVLGDDNRLTSVDYLNPIVLPQTPAGKLTVLDLLTSGNGNCMSKCRRLFPRRFPIA